MTDAYKVSVELELDDKFTGKLKEIADKLDKAGETAGKAGEGLRKFSEGGDSFVEMLKKTTESLTALGANEGLNSAVSSFDKMAAASASVAGNMKAAQEAARRIGGVSLHGQGNNKLFHASNSTASPSASELAPVAHDARSSKREASGLKSALKEFGAELAKEIGAKVAESARDALKDGVKRNADLEDINKRTIHQSVVSTGQIDRLMEELKAQEERYQVKFHGDIQPYALAIQNTARFHPRDTQEQRNDARGYMDETIDVSSYHAKNGDMGMAELAPVLAQFGKDANTTRKEEYIALLEAASTASHQSGVKISEIASVDGGRALENAAGHFDTYTMLLAAMKKTNTADQGGDVLEEMSVDNLPGTLAGNRAEDRKRLVAGQDVGLYDDKGKANFVGKDGKVDQGREFEIIAKAMLGARKNHKEEDVKEKLRAAFQGKGEQADSLIRMLGGLDTRKLQEFADITKNVDAAKNSPGFRERFEDQKTTNDKNDEIHDNFNMTAMNATVSLMGPINLLLDKGVDASKGLEKFTKDHPVLSAGALTAAVGAGYLGKAGGLGKAIGAGGETGAAAEGAGVAEAGGIAAAGAEVVAGVGVLAGVTTGMAYLLDKLDPSTDPLGHPGMRHYKKGGRDFWWKDDSLSQEHAGTYFHVYGRGGQGQWEKDDPAKLPVMPPTPTDNSHQGMHFVGRGPAGRWVKDGEPPPEENQNSRFSHQPKFDTSKDHASNVNVHFYIDSKEVAAYMIPSNSHGGTGFNTAATRMTPASSAYGHY